MLSPVTFKHKAFLVLKERYLSLNSRNSHKIAIHTCMHMWRSYSHLKY